MKRISIMLLGLILTGCGTMLPPDAVPVDFKAVVTRQEGITATAQCIVNTPTPVSGIWETLSVKSARSDEVLSFSVDQKTENMVTTSTITVEDSHWPFTAAQRRKASATNYISTAQIQVMNVSDDNPIRISVTIAGEKYEREVRPQEAGEVRETRGGSRAPQP